MIPKIIHYCWFGTNTPPPIIDKCIKSWHKVLPDYKIIRWDESNYDVNKNKFISTAYKVKKFAFVSDYARFDILSEYGGIYLDTDVELIKTLNPFLLHKTFTGFEKYDLVNPGVIIGAEKGSPLVEYMKSYYENRIFDPSRIETVVSIMTNYLYTKGLKLNNSMQIVDGTNIYPTEYFAPLGFQTGKLHKTENTVSIHHYASSWLTKSDKFKLFLSRNLTNFMGAKLFNQIKKTFKNFKY